MKLWVNGRGWMSSSAVVKRKRSCCQRCHWPRSEEAVEKRSGMVCASPLLSKPHLKEGVTPNTATSLGGGHSCGSSGLVAHLSERIPAAAAARARSPSPRARLLQTSGSAWRPGAPGSPSTRGSSWERSPCTCSCGRCGSSGLRRTPAASRIWANSSNSWRKRRRSGRRRDPHSSTSNTLTT